jgi:hypothetical protein
LPEGPTGFQAAAGAEIIVNINASPFHLARAGYASRCWRPARGKMECC